MRSIIRVVVVMSVIAMAPFVAGCFGGRSGTSLEEYFAELEQADAEFSDRQDELDDEYTEKLDVEEYSDEVRDDFQSYFEQTRGAAQNFVEDLEGLDPPGEVEDGHNEAVEQFNDCLTDTEDVGSDISGAESFEDISEILNESTGSCEDTTQSCEDLQAVADENDIDVNLTCGE